MGNTVKKPIQLEYKVMAILTTVILVGCSSSDDSGDVPVGEASVLIEMPVEAADGGVFSTSDQWLSIVIPANALADNAVLTVTEAPDATEPNGNLTGTGSSFDISLDTDIVNPIELRFSIDQPPTHPQLAESAYLAERGRDVFLYESFGNESFFGGVIGLHTLLNNLTPAAAVGVGAQVDITRVPQEIANVLVGDDFAAKADALQDPAITRALLRAEAVVGVTSEFADDSSDLLTSAGITCALCHAVVEPTEFELTENQLTPLPIGSLQLNGVPNTAMDVGKILSLTPFAQSAGADTISFLEAFGAGRFDARSLPDNPLEDGLLNPASIPPLWNFLDLAEQDYGLNCFTGTRRRFCSLQSCRMSKPAIH